MPNHLGPGSSYSPRDRVPVDHPLRAVKDIANRAMHELSRDFSRIVIPKGCPLIPPGKLIRALILQVLYSIRTDRLLMEQLDYNLLFRWFVGLSMDEEVWDDATFSQNLQQLVKTEVVGKFFAVIREQIKGQGLLSDEHFTFDWTLIEARAPGKRSAQGSNEAQDLTATMLKGLKHVRA